MKLQPVRGTRDILFDEMLRFNKVVESARLITSRYGFKEIATPIFEFSAVFKGVGATSDILSKETYTFNDRGGESLTLRPEGTAPVVRSVISNGLSQNIPLKMFYAGPMFRYDRPQKGRYRQFHQVGVELIGIEKPIADVEVIAMAYDLLKDLGLGDDVRLKINTLGDVESRLNYREALIEYFSQFENELSDDSKDRLHRNPMRILDSKDDKDIEISKKAPIYTDFLNEASKDFFNNVTGGLESLGIEFEIDPKLVRGLDYYCHSVFEFVTDKLGAQGTVLAGGRYNGLVKAMGGPDLAGIGWAAGIERLYLLRDDQIKKTEPVAIIGLGETAEKESLKIAKDLRDNGVLTEIIYSGNMMKKLKKADKISACFAIIIGDDELNNNLATVKNLDSGVQEDVSLNKLVEYIKENKSN